MRPSSMMSSISLPTLFLFALQSADGRLPLDRAIEGLRTQDAAISGWVGHFEGALRNVSLAAEGGARLKVEIDQDSGAAPFGALWAMTGDNVYWEWRAGPVGSASVASWTTGDGGWATINLHTLSCVLGQETPAGIALAPSSYFTGFGGQSYASLLQTNRAAFDVLESKRFGRRGLSPTRFRVELSESPTHELAISFEPSWGCRPVRVYRVHEDFLVQDHEVRECRDFDGVYLPVETRHFIYSYEPVNHFLLARNLSEYHLHSGRWHRSPVLDQFVGTRRLPAGLLLYNGYSREAGVVGASFEEAFESFFWHLRELDRQSAPQSKHTSAAHTAFDYIERIASTDDAPQLTDQTVSAAGLHEWLRKKCGSVALAALLLHLDPSLSLESLTDASDYVPQDASIGDLISYAADAGVHLEARRFEPARMPDLGEPFIAYLEPVPPESVGHFVCALPDQALGLWKVVDFPSRVTVVRPGGGLNKWTGVSILQTAWAPTWPPASAALTETPQQRRLIWLGVAATALLGVAIWRARGRRHLRDAAVASSLMALPFVMSCGSEPGPGSPILVLSPEPYVVEAKGQGPVSAALKLTNVGDKACRILEARATCGCVTALPSGLSIAPGEQVTVPVIIDKSGVRQFEASVEFWGIRADSMPHDTALLASALIQVRYPFLVTLDPPKLICHSADGVNVLSGGSVRVFARSDMNPQVSVGLPGGLMVPLAPAEVSPTAEGDVRLTYPVEAAVPIDPDLRTAVVLVIVGEGASTLEWPLHFIAGARGQ